MTNQLTNLAYTCRKCGVSSHVTEWNNTTKKSFGGNIIPIHLTDLEDKNEPMIFVCPSCKAECYTGENHIVKDENKVTNQTYLVTYGIVDGTELEFYVDTQWLQQYLDSNNYNQTIEEFKDSYTFDDAENILDDAKENEESSLQIQLDGIEHLMFELLGNNHEAIQAVVSECNSWDDSLNEYNVEENDEDFFELHFADRPFEAVRAVSFGNYRYQDDYVKFDGYGNLESFSEYDYHKMLQDGLSEIIDGLLALIDNSHVNFDNEIMELYEKYKELKEFIVEEE